MTKEMLLYSIVELVILLIPIITLIFRYSAWKKGVDMKIEFLEKSSARQLEYYEQVTQQLASIATVLTKLEVKFEYLEKSQKEKLNGSKENK